MSKTKMSLLDEKIAKFADSTTELLTDIHTKMKNETKGASKRGRKKKKAISAPDTAPEADLTDEEPSRIDSSEARMA